MSRKTFRRENVKDIVGIAITMSVTIPVFLVLVGLVNVELKAYEFIIGSVLAAGASWAGIGTWHRTKRQEQRGEDGMNVDLFGDER